MIQSRLSLLQWRHVYRKTEKLPVSPVAHLMSRHLHGLGAALCNVWFSSLPQESAPMDESITGARLCENCKRIGERMRANGQ